MRLNRKLYGNIRRDDARVAALVIYAIGDIYAFTDRGLVAFMKGKNLWGCGEGRRIGFLFLCGGPCIYVFGVLLMRIYRNRKGV